MRQFAIFFWLIVQLAGCQMTLAQPRQIETIESRVRQMRGLPELAETAFNFISPAELRAEQEERLADALTTASSQQLIFFYRALDFATADTDWETVLTDYYAQAVLGFYDTETKEIYVVRPAWEEAGSKLPIDDELTYAHEYTHALQDQHFDLESIYESEQESDNLDRDLAMEALVEGDATLLTADYIAGLSMKAFSELMRLSEDQAASAAIDPKLPNIIRAEQEFRYLTGKHFVLQIVGRQDWAGVDRAFKHKPPETSEQILHPARYFAGEGPIKVEFPAIQESLGADWQLQYDGPAGEFYLWQHLATRLRDNRSRALASGWGGDRLQIFSETDSENLIWLWQQVWDSEKDAAEFADGYRDFLQRSAVSESDDGLCFQATETRCFRQIGPRETRISQAPDAARARALLLSASD